MAIQFFSGPIVGHVGDGNFHCIFPVNEENDDEMREMWTLSNKIVQCVCWDLWMLDGGVENEAPIVWIVLFDGWKQNFHSRKTIHINRSPLK